VDFVDRSVSKRKTMEFLKFLFVLLGSLILAVQGGGDTNPLVSSLMARVGELQASKDVHPSELLNINQEGLVRLRWATGNSGCAGVPGCVGTSWHDYLKMWHPKMYCAEFGGPSCKTQAQKAAEKAQGFGPCSKSDANAGTCSCKYTGWGTVSFHTMCKSRDECVSTEEVSCLGKAQGTDGCTFTPATGFAMTECETLFPAS